MTFINISFFLLHPNLKSCNNPKWITSLTLYFVSFPYYFPFFNLEILKSLYLSLSWNDLWLHFPYLIFLLPFVVRFLKYSICTASWACLCRQPIFFSWFDTECLLLISHFLMTGETSVRHSFLKIPSPESVHPLPSLWGSPCSLL